MSNGLYYVLCGVLSLGVLAGIALMSKVKSAVQGNILSATCTAIAIVLTLYRYHLLSHYGLWICMALGLAAGLVGAYRVTMLEMPEVVAVLNGFGGAASALVAAVTLLEGTAVGAFSLGAAGLALVVGVITLTGSLVAGGKLHKMLPQKPVLWPTHKIILYGSLALSVAAVVGMVIAPAQSGWGMALLLVGAAASALFGIAFAVRVGGADMPITISLLNSLSGVAGSIAGMAISDPLLVAIGGIVGASGLLLTQIMCRAMNRSLVSILTGKTVAPAKPAGAQATAAKAEQAKQAAPEAARGKTAEGLLQEAKRVIIVPGYGMALAQAQGLVKQLATRLEADGKEVVFAIHPVAGRMPGHMNVLLAEVDVPYEKLLELEEVNPQFAQCDVAVVIGANDVVNPAANTAEGTPIYGMPVLDVESAKGIIICNYDLKPGYAGVDNPLYENPKTLLKLGDAAQTLELLLKGLASKQGDKNAEPEAQEQGGKKAPLGAAAKALQEARRVIIVPGYGMALAQAQGLVKQLAERLEQKGAEVAFAIHPVAGRMPGHMNVLLAEVDVPYEKLLELEEINPQFARCDVAIVIGANDVVNPAANTAEGTPIYGMPVLDVESAQGIIICNFDRQPGYAGVDNPLYESPKAVLLLGDAKESVQALTRGLLG